MNPCSPQIIAICDAKNLVNELPNSREKSMVLTKLDEAYLWLKELETAWVKE